MPNQPNQGVSESAIVRLWQNQIGARGVIQDITGETLKVVYPGRLNDSRGGDFRDAIVASPQGLQRGCIEVHTLTSGWQAHGHHLDPHYNQVVLQVAWKADRGVPAISEDGRIIPTVLLESWQPDESGDPMHTRLACREYAARWGSVKLGEILDQAGEQRFLFKSGRFQDDLLAFPSDQVLYQGLTQALGYSHNQEAFLDFAQRTPLSNCKQTWDPAGIPDLIQIQSYLLGQAGLLPVQRGLKPSADGYIKTLEKIWSENNWQALSPPPVWELYRVRPGNYPVRRLVALSHWLWQGRFSHWQDNFWLPVIKMSGRQCLQTWGQILRAEDPAYWSHYYDFGRPLTATQAVLIGGDRASEMIVNVILPFLMAWASCGEERELAYQILSIYREHPRLAANSIQRHMTDQLVLTSQSLNSACRQQGLLHIYKTLCTQGLCSECPLSI
jgi:hypothetical protein